MKRFLTIGKQLFQKEFSMKILSNVQKPTASISEVQYDVVIVGAGPYGLSAAAHLLERGLRVAIFGKPINLWREHMPKGMMLRSYWWATNIADPRKQYGLEQYFQEKGQKAVDPLPIQTFIEYGLWFQEHVVPNVDETYVETIEHQEGRFVVTLNDGRVIHSAAVVMAPGLNYYIYRPAEYSHLSPEIISHTSQHHTFDRFAGKQVLVIGGGQSALETAALAHESGASVQLISRSPLVWIQEFGSFPEHRSLIERLRAPKAGIAPGWFNWRLEHFPSQFQRLPRSAKDRLMSGPGRYGPMGAAWLKPRIEGKVLLHKLQSVQEVKEMDDGVMLTLSNNKKLKADHIILGTGYRVDVTKLPMLHSQLLSKIQTNQYAPVLNNRFESSVPGLYFVGFSAVSSCGPLYRFVVGTKAAAQRVASSVTRQGRHN
jgi:FAD-dependent urate hydroxylase